MYAFSKKDTGLLNRSYQGVAPLIRAARIDASQVFTQFDDSDKGSMAMVDHLFSGVNAGKVVAICWEHNIIPHMVRAIGSYLQPKHPLFQTFHSWTNSPLTKDKSDENLYTLTIMIDCEARRLAVFHQSGKFSADQSVLYPLSGELTPFLTLAS